VIIKDLNDGGGGNVFDTGSFDYHSAPETKQASAHGDVFDEFEKAASVEISTAFEAIGSNPFRDSMELRDKLASEYDKNIAQINGLESIFHDISKQLFHHVKQASMSGHSLGEIVSIWSDYAPDDIYVKVAFQHLMPQLIDNEVISAEGLAESLQKTASNRMVNPKHPLVTDFQEFCETVDKLASLRDEQLDIGNGLGELNTFLMKMADASNKGLLQKAVDGITWLGGHADRAGQAVGGLLLGDQHKAHAGTLARYATYAAPAVAAHEFYRSKIKHNPTVSKMMSVVPGTQEYNNREMEIMSQNQPMYPMGY
jgi:hypothetical protein